MKHLAFIHVLTAMLVGVMGDSMQAASQVEVLTIDHRSIVGMLVGVEPSAAIVADSTGDMTKVPLRQVSMVRFSPRASDTPPAERAWIVTREGDWLVADRLRVDEGAVSFNNSLIGRVRVDITEVMWIFPPSRVDVHQLEMRCTAALAGRVPVGDVLFVSRGDDVAALEGVLLGVGDSKVALNWRGEDRQMGLSNVLGVRTASLIDEPEGVAGRIIARDGSAMRFTSLDWRCVSDTTADDQMLTIEWTDLSGKRVASPVDNLLAIEYLSKDVLSLVDLEPMRVKQQGLFDIVFPYRVNASAAGGSVNPGGREYSVGLGVSPLCELVYDIEGRYVRFCAIVGINDAARPAGEAKVTVLGDGRELYSAEILGNDGPIRVDVDVLGVRELTIKVDFPAGNRLVLGGYVDIALPRLIRQE